MPDREDTADPVWSEDINTELNLIQPFTLDDIRASLDNQQEDDSELIDWDKRNHFAELCFGKGRRVSRLQSDHNLWNRALSKASSAGDEYESFDFSGLPEEPAVRYRYDAVSGHWLTDDITIKMEPEAFNAGAMRRCFRAKKPFTKGVWDRGNTNYVAKEYMDGVDRQTYFDDVKLQMEAKLWGMEYNRHNPPKKVDIMQMCVVELTGRPGQPLFHLEHYIQGDYVKYNSNSGFVRDESLRLTPQAFSHFTFERSGHEVMVVDIQGVGDLYTDPQIHTADGECYGDGNLGTRGMALFFHSHVCNAICRSLGLTEFDLAATESEQLTNMAQKQILCRTVSRGLEEICASPAEYSFDRHEFVQRSRSPSSGCWSSDDVTGSLKLESAPVRFLDSPDAAKESEFLSDRRRFISESSTGSIEAAEKARYLDVIGTKQRPSNVQAERERIGSSTALPSILGQMHFDLAKYHEVGRFLGPARDGQYDRRAALFHLEKAVECGVIPAIVTSADLYLCRPHDLLADIQLDATLENRRRGIMLLTRAAEAGERAAMVDLARAYDLGSYMPAGEEDRDWSQAVHWYERAVEAECGEASEGEPGYLLLGRAAEMLKTGGPHLEPDYNRAADMFNAAAENASAMMKGKAASRYFMQAEECWGMCEE